MGQSGEQQPYQAIPEFSANGAEEYYLRAQYWQSELNLAALYLDDEEFYSLGLAIIEDIDSVCPYLKEVVYIRGKALMPSSDALPSEIQDDEERPSSNVTILEQDEESGTVYGEVDGIIGVHNGVRIETTGQPGGSQEWCIRQMVIIGSSDFADRKGTRFGHQTLAGFFEMDSEIILAEELETMINGGEQEAEIPDDIVDRLNYFSRNLISLLQSKKFRSLPHRSQLERMERLMKEAETSAPIRDREVMIAFMSKPRVPRRKQQNSFYVVIPEACEQAIQYKRHYVTEEMIGGMCLGFTSLDSETLRKRPIRKLSDLTMRGSGLCVAVAPNDETSELIGTNQLIYIPVSPQYFDAIFE